MKKRLSPRQAIWWSLAFVVLILLVAPSAKANTGTPSECALTALAALKAAQMENPKPENFIEARFIKLSRYLWHHSRGNEARFLGWYRKACNDGRLPKYIRVKEDRVILGNEA